MEFPIISIKNFESDFDRISNEIFKASQEWGFFIVTGHGIPDADVQRMFELFFDLPMETKIAKTLNELGVGYDGHKAKGFAASEGMALGLPAGQLSQCTNLHSWWDGAKLSEVESFKAHCAALTLSILSCYTPHLGLNRDFFEASHNQTLPGNALKLMKYPKIDPGHKPTGPARLSEHSDWGSLTLLFVESAGLEVRDPNNNWHDVPVVSGGIILNIGDVLSLWTGKGLKSTLHRISWEKVPLDKDRFSIPYFAQPNFETDLHPLGVGADADTAGDPLLYKDYYRSRIWLNWGSHLDAGPDGKKDKYEGVNKRLAQYLIESEGAKVY
ncbi:hypothetical protein BDV18DRAFT_26436 [Aspergillus unguis]